MSEVLRSGTLLFTQFMHPGKEHRPRRGASFHPWGAGGHGSGGTATHGRKFMHAEVKLAFQDEPVRYGPVKMGLWGEWEGPSQVRVNEAAATLDPRWPQYIHEPVFVEPEEYHGLLDTDPFIYGDKFLYNGCRQYTHYNEPVARPTALRTLGRGSVIAFGSAVQREFVIDTVFVVHSYIDYDRGDFDSVAEYVPPEYGPIAIYPQAEGNKAARNFRLYFGATPDDPVAGMFSFVPCGPLSGFPRPHINIPGFTHDRVQHRMHREVRTIGEMGNLWGQLVVQVQSQGLDLATWVPVP